MNTVWKTRLQNAGWLVLTAGGIVLLVAAVKIKDNRVCNDIKVELSGASNNFFIDEKEVLSLLNANGRLKQTNVAAINLQLMERRLENDTWIANAELFFDKNDVLQVKVEEREPVARVFTSSGSSFYIDSACRQLPLSDRVTVRVPMFTGFPATHKKLRGADSLLLGEVKELATFIRASTFWNAQVAQVDITDERKFEIIPTVGNQVIVLGSPGDYKEKMDRLMAFYKQVWTKVGLEKYSKIDIQYQGQVVATRRGVWSAAVDSVKAKEAFENLMKENKEMQQPLADIPASIKPPVSLNEENIRSRSMEPMDEKGVKDTVVKVAGANEKKEKEGKAKAVMEKPKE